MALTSAEWLAKISEHHPAHKLWTDIDYKGTRAFRMMKEDEKFFYLKDLYEEEDDPEKTSKENQEKAEEGSLIRVLKESTNIGMLLPSSAARMCSYAISSDLVETGGKPVLSSILLMKTTRLR